MKNYSAILKKAKVLSPLAGVKTAKGSIKSLFKRLTRKLTSGMTVSSYSRKSPGMPGYGDTSLTDLQLLSFFALEDMNLKTLSDRYYEGYIGYAKIVISGKRGPVKFIQDMYCARFPKKYHKKLAAHHKLIEGMKGTW